MCSVYVNGLRVVQLRPQESVLVGFYCETVLRSLEVMLFYTEVYDFLSMLEFRETTLIPPRFTDPGRLLTDESFLC